MSRLLSEAPWVLQGNGVPRSDLGPLQLRHLRFLLQRARLPDAVAARRPRQRQRRSRSARLRGRLFLWPSGGNGGSANVTLLYNQPITQTAIFNMERQWAIKV